MSENEPLIEKSTPVVDKKNNGATPKVKGYLNIYPGNKVALDDKITDHLSEIQKAYSDTPLWVIMQDGDDDKELGDLADKLWNAFYKAKEDFISGEPIILLIVSPGGDAESAYRIAKFIRNKCGEFKVILPSIAKSAATLLALGAENIFMSKEADLGPLDVQIFDHNEERGYSALDEVQSIDGLFDFATTQIINTTAYWSRALRKKKAAIFPSVIEYVAGMMKPLMEKIDTVHYMSLSRTLRIAEEYAYRLLSNKYGYYKAKIIAKHFVEKYPYHGFIIDIKECEEIGLTNVNEISEDIQNNCDALLALTNNCEKYLIGKFSLKS